MEQKILGFSGRQQSGKTSCSNYILGMYMWMRGIVKGQIGINKNGDLYITDILGDTSKEGVFNPYFDSPDMRGFLAQHVDAYVRLYSMADILKQEVCINLLGLDWKSCYGTNEEKNKPTHLRWENFPGCVTVGSIWDRLLTAYDGKVPNNLFFHKPGFMSGREAMQYAGTEFFRNLYGDSHAKATLKRIKEDNSEVAIIMDIRFPNEVGIVQENGGVVARLTRNGDVPTEHTSETMLDKENYDWKNFDIILKNDDLTIDQQNQEVVTMLVGLGWVEPKVETVE